MADVGKHHRHCETCPALCKKDELYLGKYCKKCKGEQARLISERREMEDQKALINATKQLANQIARQSKDTAVGPKVFDSFLKRIGGAEKLGERLFEDFEKLHGEGLTETQQKFFVRDDKTIQRYWQTLLQFSQNQDKANAVDIGSLSDQELQATLFSLACSLIVEDREFRHRVIELAVANDPELIWQLARDAELPLVEGRTHPKDDDAPDYE